MILRVDIRGNAPQFGRYLYEKNENEYTEILEVDGREDATPEYLEQVILSMAFNAELTKSDKAFFHAQINPAYGEDKVMTRADWYLAADILAKGTGYENQRRVITLHTKKGRTHAHVGWERYNHETGKMIDNKHSKLKADATRPIMERALGHELTPHRNPHRLDLKQAATEIWNRTSTGAEFVQEARKAGYMVASGTGNRPFMIVDSNGRSFDLVRQLEGVRTKEVRARLRNEPLITDKEAITLMRKVNDGKTDGKDKTELKSDKQQKFAKAASLFSENKKLVFAPTIQNKYKAKTELFISNQDNLIEKKDKEYSLQELHKQQKQKIAKQFADERAEILLKKEEIRRRMQEILKAKEKDNSRDFNL